MNDEVNKKTIYSRIFKKGSRKGARKKEERKGFFTLGEKFNRRVERKKGIFNKTIEA